MFSFFRSNPSPSPETQSPTPQQPQPSQPEPPAPDSAASTPKPTAAADDPLPKLWTPKTNTKLFFGGLAFFTLSVLTTRRSLRKRRLASIPPFYTSSVYHKPKVNGAGEAFEALNLATLNVLSFAMMASGGVLSLLGINGIEDMRTYVRTNMLGENDVQLSAADQELEKEVEEWIGKYLGEKFVTLAKEEKEREKEKETKS